MRRLAGLVLVALSLCLGATTADSQTFSFLLPGWAGAETVHQNHGGEDIIACYTNAAGITTTKRGGPELRMYLAVEEDGALEDTWCEREVKASNAIIVPEGQTTLIRLEGDLVGEWTLEDTGGRVGVIGSVKIDGAVVLVCGPQPTTRTLKTTPAMPVAHRAESFVCLAAGAHLVEVSMQAEAFTATGAGDDKFISNFAGKGMGFWVEFSAGDAKISVAVPVHVDVQKDAGGATANVSGREAEQIIEKANDILAPSNVQLVFDRDKHYRAVADGGNGNLEIESAKEFERMRALAAAEVAKKPEDGGFDGKGYGVFFTNKIHNYLGPQNALILGVTANDHFFSAVARGTGQQVKTNDQMALTLAHEVGHGLGLLKGHRITPTRVADVGGHDPTENGNLMWADAGTSTGSKLERCQHDRVLSQSARVGVVKKKVGGGQPLAHWRSVSAGRPQAPDAHTVSPVPTRRGSWTDPGKDVPVPAADVVGGSLTAMGPADSMLVQIEIDSLFARTGPPFDATYQIAFDADGSSGTGTTVGSLPGVDRVVTIRLTGAYPFESQSGLATATLVDVITGETQPLRPVSVRPLTLVSEVESGATPDTMAIRDVIEVDVALSELRLSAPEVPYAVRAWADSTAADVDETVPHSFTWLPIDSTTIAVEPMHVAVPGTDSLAVTACCFTPSSGMTVFLDGDSLSTGLTDATGLLSLRVPMPQVASGTYFVTVLDTMTSIFDFSLIEVASLVSVETRVSSRLGLQIIGPNPTTASLGVRFRYEVPASTAQLSVDLVDVAGRRIAWLLNGPAPAGAHLLHWKGPGLDQLSPGVYFLRLASRQERLIRTLVLTR